jgi:hypothetical protein
MFDASGLLEAITTGLSTLPSALIAAVLLGAPTAIWLLTRVTFGNDKQITLIEDAPPERLLWLCGGCKSINDDALELCYHCNRSRHAGAPPIVIDVGPYAPEVGVAVGPGKLDEAHVPDSWLGGDLAPLAAQATGHRRKRSTKAPRDDVSAAMAEPPRPKATRSRRRPPGA